MRHLLTTFYNQPNEIVAFDLIHYEGLGNVQPQFTPANSTVEYHGDDIRMVVKDGKKIFTFYQLDRTTKLQDQS